MSDGKVKVVEATHPYAYTDAISRQPLTAEDECRRIKENNLTKPQYYSFTTNEELRLIDACTKKKINRQTGKPIQIRAHFKKKDYVRKNKDNVEPIVAKQMLEEGIPVSVHESLLHELAKTCFIENKPFILKGLSVQNYLYKYDNSMNPHYSVLDTDIVIVSTVETEKSITLLDEYGSPVKKRPDLKLRCYHLDTKTGIESYFDLYMEIAVKHKKSKEDIQLFKMNNLNVLEIDLSNLIDLASRISEIQNEESISPKQFLNRLNSAVLTDISKQTWLSNKLENKYNADYNSNTVRIEYIERCKYRNDGQEGMLPGKCDLDPKQISARTIVNLRCFRCNKCIGTIGNYDYIRKDERIPDCSFCYLVCGDNPERFIVEKDTTKEANNVIGLNITHGYDNL